MLEHNPIFDLLSSAPARQPAALYMLKFQNGKIYLGISTNPRKRMRLHKAHALRGSEHLVHRALRKYGVDSIKPQILAVGERGYILDLEQRAIAAFCTQDPVKGYNLSAGGESNPMDAPGAREKCSRALTGRKRPASVVARQKASWTPETRAILSATHAGKKISVQHKRAIGLLWDSKGERRIHGTTHKSKWTPERLADAEALPIWRDLTLTTEAAVAKMPGWSASCAYRVLGRRTAQ